MGSVLFVYRSGFLPRKVVKYKYGLPALGIISVSTPPIRPVSTRHTRQIDGGDGPEGMRNFIQKQGKIRVSDYRFFLLSIKDTLTIYRLILLLSTTYVDMSPCKVRLPS